MHQPKDLKFFFLGGGLVKHNGFKDSKPLVAIFLMCQTYLNSLDSQVWVFEQAPDASNSAVLSDLRFFRRLVSGHPLLVKI